jgi:hypothetical protein
VKTPPILNLSTPWQNGTGCTPSKRVTGQRVIWGSECCGRLAANEGHLLLSVVIELWMFRSMAEGIRRIHLAADRKYWIVVNMAVNSVSHEMVVVILD